MTKKKRQPEKAKIYGSSLAKILWWESPQIYGDDAEGGVTERLWTTDVSGLLS